MILLYCLFFTCSVSFAAQGDTVAFNPTDVRDAGELTYLRESVRLMMASRLASVAGIQPLLVDKKGAGPKADYRVESKLASGDGGAVISVIVTQAGADTPLRFQTAAVKHSEVVGAIQGLVDEMAAALFGVQSQKVVEEEVVTAATTDFHTPHPDRQLKENSGFGLSIKQEEYIAEMAVAVSTTERNKSTVLSFRTRGMSAGDLDGDGLDEIAVATNMKIYLYQLRDKRIYPVTSIPLPANLNVHALNVADLNTNGVMEIYVSATRNDEPVSFVLEWHPETGVQWLYKEVPLYIKPLRIPGKGMILAGQSGGLEGGTIAGIYQLDMEAGGVPAKVEQLPVPDSVNLFEFVFADLEGDQVPEVVAISRKEELKVYNSNLEEIYTSPSGFGGRELVDGLNPPVRIVVTDFDTDGNDDVLLVDNELFTSNMLKNSRYYKNGQVRGLVWDRDLFLEMWRTNIFQKAIVDFQFLPRPAGKSGGKGLAGRLFVAEPAKAGLQGFLFNDGGTRLSVFGMEFTSKAR